MKSAIIAVCIVACAYASSVDQVASVVRSAFTQSADGNYEYAYETDNGIFGQAVGAVKAVGKESALEVSGSNSFKSPEGEVYRVDYIANEYGYQPSGAHLPTTPAPVPIPDYIAKAIAYIAAHPYSEKKV